MSLKEDLKARYDEKVKQNEEAENAVVQENFDMVLARVKRFLLQLAERGATECHLKDNDIFGGDAKWTDSVKHKMKIKLYLFLEKEGLRVRSGRELYVADWHK